MNIIVTRTFMISPSNTHAKRRFQSRSCLMKSALTRLFLKLPGCEIDLDAREFDSTTEDFEFEKVSFWIKFVKKLTVFSISNFFIFRFQIFKKPLSMNSGQENQTCTGTSRCVI